MATDIAFAIGVLGLLGRRIPSAARLFLLTLAIVDDIGAILVIAVFYTDDLDLVALAIAVGLLGLMVVMRMLRIWSVPAYLVVGVLVWLATLESGVHATLAGVAIGLLTPATPLLQEKVARSYAQEALSDQRPRRRRAAPVAVPAQRVGVDRRTAAGPAPPDVGLRRAAGVRARQRWRGPARWCARRRCSAPRSRSASLPAS